MKNVILCTGTRTSSFNSSISERRAKHLCTKFAVVINEIHNIDMLERNLTCTWDVFVTDQSMVNLVRELLTAVLAPAKMEVHEREEKAFDSYTMLVFHWHGGDDVWGRPPKMFLGILRDITEAFRGLGFSVTFDEITQEKEQLVV